MSSESSQIMISEPGPSKRKLEDSDSNSMKEKKRKVSGKLSDHSSETEKDNRSFKINLSEDYTFSEFVKAIFGAENLNLEFLDSEATQKEPCLLYIPVLLRGALVKLTLETPTCTSQIGSQRTGRIGPDKVILDIHTQVGLVEIGTDKLSACSQNNFSTILANTCAYSGKWMYEVQLGSKGLMQIGWAAKKFPFSTEIGVGDTSCSYAYDGNRVKAWNISAQDFGEEWLSGDIIGTTINLDEGFIKYYRNGKDLGVAFNKVRMGPELAYFPGFSFSFLESFVANFGAHPFTHPVEGYLPLESSPREEILKSKYLFRCFENFLDLCKRGKEVIIIDKADEISDEAFLLATSGLLIVELGPLLSTPYIVNGDLIDFLMKLSSSTTPVSHSEKIEHCDVVPDKTQHFFDLFWLFLENDEIVPCLALLISGLLMKYRTISPNLVYKNQKSVLRILVQMMIHMRTREYLLQHVFFEDIRFLNFLHLKPMDEEELSCIIDCTYWTEQCDETFKAEYLDSIKYLKSSLKEMEMLQFLLIKKFLARDELPMGISTRILFLRKLRKFILNNYVDYRSSVVQVPQAFVLCFFFRLLGAARYYWELETDNADLNVPLKMFYDGSCNFLNIDRFGGVHSHLRKTLRPYLIKELGQTYEPEQASNAEEIPESAEASTSTSSRQGFNQPQNVLATIPLIQQSSFDRETTSMLRRRSKSVEEDPTMYHFIDSLLIFYHMAAHRQLLKVSNLRESRDNYLKSLGEAYKRRNSLTENDDIEGINSRLIHVFMNRMLKQTKNLAWVQAFIYSEERQSDLAWLLKSIVFSLRKASAQGPLFSFVPYFYLDALMEIVVALKNGFHPTAPLEQIPGSATLFTSLATFLCEHINDPRIIHANSKVTLIQAIACFVNNETLVRSLENVPQSSSERLLINLTYHYEHRAWAISNWILVRFWQGNGFAFRYENSPHLNMKLGPKLYSTASDTSLISHLPKPTPSPYYLSKLAQILERDEMSATKFLHSVLSQLNWAFSEFIGMLQEIQTLSQRQERVFIQARQLQICVICFDLVISLLRVLEMVVSVARVIFSDSERSSSESLLERLCQMMCQILNRVCACSGCFQHVIDLDIPDLDPVDHFPILTAVLGILIALTKGELLDDDYEGDDVPPMCKALLGEPSFEIESVNFVIRKYNKKKSEDSGPKKLFTLYFYPDEISGTEILKVHDFISSLTMYSTRMSSITNIDEDDLCPICYANPMIVTFDPCHHKSCKSCIVHHLMNSKECFYCKALIIKVIDSQDKIIYDRGTDSNTSQPGSSTE